MSESASPEIRTLIDGFEGRLVRLGRAPATSIKYRQALNRFEEWLGERPLSSIGPAQIEEFLDWWWKEFERVRGRAPGAHTQRNLIAALKAFFRYLEHLDLLKDDDGRLLRNPAHRVEAPRVEQRSNDWLHSEDDERLLFVDCSAQERMIVWLLRWTGLRVEEASKLLISDLDLSPGNESVRVRASKTPAGRRTIPLPPELLPIIRTWLDHLHATGRYRPSGYLLSTRNETAMKPTYIWRVVKRVAYRAGVRPIHCTCRATTRSHEPGCAQSKSGENCSEVAPHTLRRTYGSYLINERLALDVVSKYLGHKNTSVTEDHYTELLDTRAREEFMRVFRGDAAA